MADDDLSSMMPSALQEASGEGASEEDERTEALAPRSPYRSLARTTLPEPLGPYVLERRLGIGGMAEVFLARKDGPAGCSKQIVVKRILPHLAEDQRFVDMFLREAQTAAELNHTNIVQAYELGETDGQYYIAMEYVDGVTLYKLARRAWRKGRSIPMEVILRSIADAALGLHHAHTMVDRHGRKAEVVHRDISPDNIIISRGGMTKVLDFGIAKGTDSRGATKTGELKGKIPYMSPEQIRGEPLDGRSDLYSLGITLYWLLTGERPFDGATELMTLQGALTDEARPPSLVNPHIPPAVDEIVLSLLEKDPKHRPRSGAELYDALNSLVPTRTSESASFVDEMMDVPDDETPASVPGSGGFVPSTPLTTKLSSGGRRVIHAPPKKGRRSPASLYARSRGAGSPWSSVLSASGSLSVTTLGARGEAVQALSSMPPTTVGTEPAVVREPHESPASEAARMPEDEAPPGTADVVEPPPPSTPPPVETKRQAEPQQAQQPQVQMQKQKRAATRVRRAQAAMKAVTTRAPAGVSWAASGKAVGRGSRSVEVPASTEVLIATTPQTLGKSRVRVVNGVADCGSLSPGRLSLRVFPFAKVSVGKKRIGTTPLSPISLVEGVYTVRLEHEGKVVTKTVQVEPGGMNTLKVDMRNE